MSQNPLISIAILALVAGPLAGQELSIPDDWTWRSDGDAKQASGQEVGPGEVRFVRMPPGWHVTTTTTGVVLHPKDHVVQGRYGVQVEVFWFPNRVDGEWAAPSDEPWGIVLDRVGVPADDPERMQFVIRRDGMVQLQVLSDGAVTPLSEWKADSTVGAHDGKTITKYVLRMEYAAERVTFSVNGKDLLNVHVGEAPYPVRPGLRVGAGLNMHVSRYDLLTPLAPPRPPRAPEG